MQSYEKIKLLKGIYFEDSYVTAIKGDETGVEFSLDLVLNKQHEKYEDPKENEKYCYVPVILKFNNASAVSWKRIFMKASIDKNKSVDFGNIDSFRFDGDTFYLEGEWGEVVVSGAQLDLVFC